MSIAPVRNYQFQDEFNGPAGTPPDPAKWVHETGRWTDNNELETYTSSTSNCCLDGQGNLRIRALKTASGYTSARITTQGKFAHYGRTWEARMKLPCVAGTWPAWWFIGANYGQVGWPACGEVDAVENYGGRIIETSVHTPKGSNDIYTRSQQQNVDTGWHTYRMFWDEPGSGEFVFHMDDHLYLTARPGDLPNWCFDTGVPLFIILNLAIGGTAAGPVPPSTQFPIDMLVDYVRVW